MISLFQKNGESRIFAKFFECDVENCHISKGGRRNC